MAFVMTLAEDKVDDEAEQVAVDHHATVNQTIAAGKAIRERMRELVSG